jgi:hypothetical protein
MIGRMMASALALTGAAYAQTSAPTGDAATAADCTPTPTCAIAPPPGASGRVAYEAAFFAQYNPQTAADMVRQTPGFSLDGGDDRRGFSGAVGNLLIDGVRPSSKSQSLDGILSRIPASQVVRLEVLRGADVAGDASGQSVLLNVVRTSSAGSGVWQAGFEYSRAREVAAPQGEASYSGRNGQIEYGLGASIYSQYRDLPGWRRIYDPADTHIANASTPSPRDYREAALNGNIAFPMLGGRLGATGQINANRFHADNDFLFTDIGSVPLESLFTVFEERSQSFEVGVNYDRDLGPWSLALIGLVGRNHYESQEDARDEDGFGGLNFSLFQAVQQDSGETILRGALSRSLGPQHRIEFGGEGAFNTLDQQLDLTGSPPIGPIPNSNVLVEEERAELFGSHTWRPSERWSVETRLAWETSTLTFTGDTDQSVALSYWKPSVQLTRTLAGANQLRFRIYRDVGQLDFGDFTSAAAIADSLIAGGNPDLLPQTTWRAELGADFRFPGGAALGLTLTQHQITDVADVVLITVPDLPNPDILFDAPGNIGEGEATSLEVNFSTPIRFIPGGRLTIEGSLWDTEVTDPVTGQPRIISYRPESDLSFNFRQDLSAMQLAWGISYFKESENQAYRFNEIDTSEEGPFVDLFIETTALPNGMKLRATAANVLDGTINRERRFYDPDRSGTLVRREVRERQFAQAPWFILQLSGTF